MSRDPRDAPFWDGLLSVG